MEALLTSTAVVALAEIGDKTQLLAIVLATRFKRPAPIIAGILFATLANHFLAALVGEQAAAFLDGQWFRYAVAISFIVMAGWTLIPDTFDEDEARPATVNRELAMRSHLLARANTEKFQALRRVYQGLLVLVGLTAILAMFIALHAMTPAGFGL